MATGTVTTSTDAAGNGCSAIATIEVAGESPRSEPSGALPPVNVIRSRASGGLPESAITAIAPALMCSRSGSGSPRPSADLRSRCR